MITSPIRTARRFALTVAVAGFTSIAVAPAAFAAPTDMPDTSHHVISQVTGDLVKVPFFCDADKVHKQHGNCIELGGPRF